MRGIIVGVDGSAHSSYALEWAAREAAIRKVPLTVLAVDQAVVGCTGYAVAYMSDQDIIERTRVAAQDQADKALEQLDKAPRPLSVTVRGAVGIPADQLVDAAADADMLVVGARGTSSFSKLLLGPVSLQVIGHAPCPVAVIHDSRREGPV